MISDKTCTQANMLASFPLTTARDRHVMLPGVTRHISKFLHEATQNGRWICPTHQWSQLHIGESIALEVMVFSTFFSLSPCCPKAFLSGTVFVVAPSKIVHNCCIPY